MKMDDRFILFVETNLVNVYISRKLLIYFLWYVKLSFNENVNTYFIM